MNDEIIYCKSYSAVTLEDLAMGVCYKCNASRGCSFSQCPDCTQPCKAFIRKELRRLCGLPQVDTEASTEEHDTP